MFLGILQIEAEKKYYHYIESKVTVKGGLESSQENKIERKRGMWMTEWSEIVELENNVGIKSFPSLSSYKNAYAIDRLFRGEK